jgi:hypothetical protein
MIVSIFATGAKVSVTSTLGAKTVLHLSVLINSAMALFKKLHTGLLRGDTKKRLMLIESPRAKLNHATMRDIWWLDHFTVLHALHQLLTSILESVQR